jgi:restriction system protein
MYECDFVSPYSKSAGNVDASLMVLLQDWSCDDRLKGSPDPDAAALGYTPTLWTNRHLIELLRRHFGLGLAEIFVTNVFPFVKEGSMNARIPQKDLIRAAEEFALPQIEIVAPTIAAGLGVPAFNALRQAVGLRRVSGVAEGIESPFRFGSTEIWCQAHTGLLGSNNRNRGGVDRVNADWARMATAQRSRATLGT